MSVHCLMELENVINTKRISDLVQVEKNQEECTLYKHVTRSKTGF